MSFEKVVKARELVRKGCTVELACKQAGVSVGTYYHHKKKRTTPNRQVPVVVRDVPVPSSKIVMVVGSTQDILNMMRNFQ